jgi:hypothetical protein
VHLADVGTRPGPQRLADVRETQVAGALVGGADAAEDRGRAFQLLGVAALGDPPRAQGRQAGTQVDRRR